MQLWQMDVMGGVRLASGAEAKLVTGVDDHSRYCVAAGVVHSATAQAVCRVLTQALERCRPLWPHAATSTASRSW